MNNPEAFKEDEVRSIKFVVPGLPFGKQRPKVTVRKFTGSDDKEKKFAKAYTPEKTVNYENLVIDERRKKVKEVLNQPYAEFEKELKEITDLIKKQSAEIDEQVKAFETAEKEEKRAKIMEAYEKAVGNLAEILPFSKVFDQRYLNKTCKLESAIADVQKKIEQVKTDLETIESVCGKYKLNAKDIYVRTLDLSKAMAEEKRLKDLEEKLEAERIQKEKAAEERRKAEEARKAEAERIRKEEEQKEIERQKKAEEERIAAEKAEAEKKQSVPEMSRMFRQSRLLFQKKEGK